MRLLPEPLSTWMAEPAQTVDRKPLDDAAGPLPLPTPGRGWVVGNGAGGRAVELDHRRAGEIRLAGAVDDHRLGDGGQHRGQRDRVGPAAGDAEQDAVGAARAKLAVLLAEGSQLTRAVGALVGEQGGTGWWCRRRWCRWRYHRDAGLGSTPPPRCG